MDEQVFRLAEMVSLAITAPTIILAVWAVYLFAGALFADQRPSLRWFACGICVGFFGATFDNLYWSIAWTSQFLGLESTKALFDHGVFANIPFRQTCGTIAAYCHIRAVFVGREDPRETVKGTKELNQVTVISLFVGCIGVLLMTWFR